jgi:hypothetical protein
VNRSEEAGAGVNVVRVKIVEKRKNQKRNRNKYARRCTVHQVKFSRVLMEKAFDSSRTCNVPYRICEPRGEYHTVTILICGSPCCRKRREQHYSVAALALL